MSFFKPDSMIYAVEDRNSRIERCLACGDLVSKQFENLTAWPHKGESR